MCCVLCVGILTASVEWPEICRPVVSTQGTEASAGTMRTIIVCLVKHTHTLTHTQLPMRFVFLQ